MRVYWMPSPKYTPGHPRPVVALVHHRMVGTLAGTDATFARDDGRPASTNFGIGWCTKHGADSYHVHQYVRLGDMAWGNGNWDASGSWDDRYPTTLINSRTVSIEHEDGGGLPHGAGKGVVVEPIIDLSIELDRLLLSGDRARMEAAGIRFTVTAAGAVCRELKAIPVDRHHIIDHHYISGRLKPYCWRPWADDKAGFPQPRYLAALSGAVPPDSSTGDDPVKSFTVPEARTLAKVADLAWLYDNSALAASDANVRLSPSRELVLVGTFSADVRIVAYEPTAPDANASSRAMFVKASDIVSVRPAADLTPYSKGDLDAAVAKYKTVLAARPLNGPLVVQRARQTAGSQHLRIATIQCLRELYATLHRGLFSLASRHRRPVGADRP